MCFLLVFKSMSWLRRVFNSRVCAWDDILHHCIAYVFVRQSQSQSSTDFNFVVQGVELQYYIDGGGALLPGCAYIEYNGQDATPVFSDPPTSTRARTLTPKSKYTHTANLLGWMHIKVHGIGLCHMYQKGLSYGVQSIHAFWMLGSRYYPMLLIRPD